MDDYLTAKDVLLKAKKNSNDFNFKSKLQVINLIEKKTKDGNPFLVVGLRDITDEILNIKKWFSNKEEFEIHKKNLEVGNIIEITGKFDKNWGNVIIEDLKKIHAGEFNLKDFVNAPDLDKDALFDIISKTILKIKNEKLKNFLEVLFADENIKEKFINCPSSITKHHSYKHGNIEHTVGMIKVFDQLITQYGRSINLNVDLIYTGIIVHDIGKALEYIIYNGVPKINTGGVELHGHLVLGAQLISRYMSKIDGFPADLKNQVRHMILSHHGKKEWNSIVKPQFPEAEFLHLLDMIDSRFRSE